MEEYKKKDTQEKDYPEQKDKDSGTTGPTIEIKDALKVIHSHIDSMQKQLDHEFEKVPLIKVGQDQERYHFICENQFWDLWFRKLFAQLISVKVWVLALITILLVTEFITASVFGTLFGVIMGLKGAFQVAEIWKNYNDISPLWTKHKE